MLDGSVIFNYFINLLFFLQNEIIVFRTSLLALLIFFIYSTFLNFKMFQVSVIPIGVHLKSLFYTVVNIFQHKFGYVLFCASFNFKTKIYLVFARTQLAFFCRFCSKMWVSYSLKTKNRTLFCLVPASLFCNYSKVSWLLPPFFIFI